MGTTEPGLLSEERTSRPLLRSAYSLVANSAVNAVLGMVFWVAAARLFPRATIGRDAALIAVLIELSTLCQLNLANGIARFLPTLGPRSARMVARAYLLSGAVAACVGTGFVLLAGHLPIGLSFLTDDGLLGVLFAASLVLWGVFALQDAVLVATRRAAWVPLENGAFGIAKLAALVAIAVVGSAHGVFLAWVIPMMLLVVPVNALVFARAIPGHVADRAGHPPAPRPQRGPVVTFLVQDYAASVFTQATLTLLPIVVLASVGATENAYFAIAFTIVMAFDMLFYGMSTALVVEGALATERLAELATVLVRRFVGILVPGFLALVVAAPLILLPFGHAYVGGGTGVLRLLACGSLFRAIIALYGAIARVRSQTLRLAAIEATLLLLVIGAAIPLADALGVEGVALAWAGANALIGMALLPSLVRFLRSRAVVEAAASRLRSQ